MTEASTFDIECARLENGSKTAVPTDLYVRSPCDTKRLLPFKTFIPMKNSLAFDGNFAQRVHSVFFYNTFIGYIYS